MRYRGYYYDVETGLYYLRSRYYDPVTCRFINQDNLLGANRDTYKYNLFAYCSNNPTNMMDSTGQFATAALGLFIGILAAVGATGAALASGGNSQPQQSSGISGWDVFWACTGWVPVLAPFAQTHWATKAYDANAQKKEQAKVKEQEKITIPQLGKPVFPPSPELFHPKGLVRSTDVMTSNGRIYKWTVPGSDWAIFEWDEDYTYGSHYHCLTEEMKNQHSGDHRVAGTVIPEPWASIYFS